MQSNSNNNESNNRRRWSPYMRQSAVGLTILASLGLLGGIIAWLTNLPLVGVVFVQHYCFPMQGE